MSRGYEDINSASIEDLLEFRLAAAIDLRKQIGLPSDVNTVYRLVNGEGDRLGGLIVDVFGNRVVVQSTAVWVELRKDMIMSLLSKLLGSDSILLWRRAEARLKQDGFVSSAVTTTDKDTMQETSTLDDNIIVFENGVKFNVNTENSQKTGFYCDQRDNRMMIAAMSKGKTVLDLYCYSAGFSVYAAKNGAMR
jgi:23S rRNA (cytosine1962-C5)-methyltransferase